MPVLWLCLAGDVACQHTVEYLPDNQFQSVRIVEPVWVKGEFTHTEVNGTKKTVKSDYLVPANSYVKQLSPEELAKLEAAVKARSVSSSTAGK